MTHRKVLGLKQYMHSSQRCCARCESVIWFAPHGFEIVRFKSSRIAAIFRVVREYAPANLPRLDYTEAEGVNPMNNAIGWHNQFLCVGRLSDGHFVIRWRAAGGRKAALETGRPDKRGRRTLGRHALPRARNRIIPQKHFDECSLFRL